MKKKLIGLFALVACVVVSGCTTGLNITKEIKADNIKITVLGSEQVTVDNGELALGNGDYVKVKMTIENTGDTTYEWSLLNFKLGDDIPSLLASGQDDILSSSIAPGENATGYIYFDKTDADTLEYTSNSYVDGDSIKTETAKFKIK